MKIGIVTHNGYDNYGQILQKYALQQILKHYAESVDVIWHHTFQPFLPLEWVYDKDTAMKIYKNAGSRHEFGFKLIRQSRLKHFNDRNIPTRYDFIYLEDLADEYDFFVVGSDQVWHPGWTAEGSFLEFAPKHKRIAYAASFGVSEIPELYRVYFRQGLSGIPYISVREDNAVDIVNGLVKSDRGGGGHC